MKYEKIFEALKKLNPWPVEYLPAVETYVDSVLGSHGKEKDNRLLLDLLDLIVDKLETFPPDPDFFEEPKAWFDDVHIWVTITRKHRQITLTAHYRKSVHKCVIIEMKIK